MNLGFFLYYLSLPVIQLRVSVVGRDLPNDWLTVAVLIMNLPGFVFQATWSRRDMTTPLGVGLPLMASTVFWAMIAVFVEWARNRLVNSQAPKPARPSASN